jgi:hypothetical protein
VKPKPTVNPIVDRSKADLGAVNQYNFEFIMVNQLPAGGKYLIELPAD